MLKAGNVRLLLSRSICSGKYMVLIGGETAAVEAAVAAGAEAANGCLIDSFVIANVHPDVFTALGRTQPVRAERRAGHPRIVQRRHARSQAADAAAKAADVQLLEIRLAMALGGKAFVHHDRRCRLGAGRRGRRARGHWPKPACWSTPW